MDKIINRSIRRVYDRGKRTVTVQVSGLLQRTKERQRNILCALLLICSVAVISFHVNGFFSNARAENTPMELKYYKSIHLERGDTLWDIASRMIGADSSDSDINSCVKEIIRINRLSNDQITAGSYLIVPYYSN